MECDFGTVVPIKSCDCNIITLSYSCINDHILEGKATVSAQQSDGEMAFYVQSIGINL